MTQLQCVGLTEGAAMPDLTDVDSRLVVAALAWRRAQAGGAGMVADALYRELDRALEYRSAVAAGLVTITEEKQQ